MVFLYFTGCGPAGPRLLLAAEDTMSEPIQLNDEDVAYLLTLLRNATQPVTTQALIDALRRHSGA